MKENQKKAFDFAADTTKQLITLSTAIITITITFSKDLTSKISENSLWYIFVAWGLFILSIFFGIFTLMALTGSLQPLSKEKKSEPEEDKEKEEEEDANCYSINGTNVRLPSILQILTFIFGIVFTVFFGFKTFSASDKSIKTKPITEGVRIIEKVEYSVEPSNKIDTIVIEK